jgi:hypothetical protein
LPRCKIKTAKEVFLGFLTNVFVRKYLPDEANIPDLAPALAVEIRIPKEDDSLLPLSKRVYAALPAHQFAHLRVHRREFILTYKGAK